MIPTVDDEENLTSMMGLPPASELSMIALSIDWISGAFSLEIALTSNKEVELRVRIAR
jgi:hypothetical protein